MTSCSPSSSSAEDRQRAIEEWAIAAVFDFMEVALGPDPVRHGCDLTDVIAARKFRATMDELREVLDGFAS